MTDERKQYAAKIAELGDAQLVKEAEMVVWMSAFANNNPRASAHWQADMMSDEARRREKPWLYAQGRNAALRSCGYDPTEADIEAASPKTGEAVR